MSQKTQTSITVEYQKIMQLVANLVEDYNDLIAMVSTLDTQIENMGCNVNCGWYGEGATAYLKKCYELKEQIQSNANVIKEAASTISSMASAYRKAELKAIGIVEANVVITISNDGTVSYSSGGSSGGGTR